MSNASKPACGPSKPRLKRRRCAEHHSSEAAPQTDDRVLRLASGYIVLPGLPTPPRKDRVAGTPVRPGGRLDGEKLDSNSRHLGPSRLLARMHLRSVLRGAHSYLAPQATLAGLAPEIAVSTPAGAEHSIAEI